MEAVNVFVNSVVGYWNYLVSEVTFNYDYKPWYQNYFYGLIVVSAMVYALELAFPWRKQQKPIRKDFWMDMFYMFFNFFIFSLFVNGFYDLLAFGFGKMGLTLQSFKLLDMSNLPNWVQLGVFFVLNDFVQWFTHVMLHRFPALWRFHKVHHSVQEMGFAAHLRYHWMENILYKPLKTLAVMVIGGFEPQQAFFIHFIAITIGHLNHANVRITWGPLKYLFNNSVMHLYHHAKQLPASHPYGMNFGISLSIWDYLFKTDYIPQSTDGSYALGFDGIETYPNTFWQQLWVGFGKGQ